MNMLNRGTDFLKRKLKGSAGTTLRLRRGPNATEPFVGTKGGTDFDQVVDESHVQNVRGIDWIVAPGDLVIGGELVTPKRGDRIDEYDSAGVVTHSYQVAGEAGMPPWEWLGSTRDLMRVHCKEVRKGEP